MRATSSHGGGTHFQGGTGYISRTVTVSGLVNGPNAITFTATDAVGHTSSFIAHDHRRPHGADRRVRRPRWAERSRLCFGLGQSPLLVTVHVTDFAVTSLSSTSVASWGGSVPQGGGMRTANITLVQGLNTITVRAQDQYGRQASAT